MARVTTAATSEASGAPRGWGRGFEGPFMGGDPRLQLPAAFLSPKPPTPATHAVTNASTAAVVALAMSCTAAMSPQP